MMNYTLSFPNPSRQVIDIEIHTHATCENPVFHLPKWRPGRYELQRFDKLIADVSAKNKTEKTLSVSKLTTHTWQIQAEIGEEIRVNYRFYANQRDSGGSLFDAEGIYINPCNLLLYTENSINEACTLTLNIPSDYEVATGLKKEGNTLYAKDFHELADAPFFAGNNMLHHTFQVLDLKVHLWFWGECKPDLAKFEKDITAYTTTQIELYGDCPVPEYHYLLQILPYKYRHGVEHQHCSVNTFGPGLTLMQNDRYESFIELLSHEFFHTWNVKYVRPADMYPYDYGKENYSELHYVTEGVTSYYGDLMLLKSGVYSVKRFLKNFNIEVEELYAMPGKDYISLTQSSFNSWVNGYGIDTGIPNRKISFYTKGYIVAFLLDYEIRQGSQNQYSMDNVLRDTYQIIAKSGRGYTENDYKKLCEQYAGKDLTEFFEKYIHGTVPLEDALRAAGKYMGWTLKIGASSVAAEAKWGLKLNGNSVEGVYPNSPAEQAGISKGDEIVAINHKKATMTDALFQYFAEEENISIIYFHFEQLKEAILQKENHNSRPVPFYADSPFPIESAEDNRNAWQKMEILLSLSH